MNRKKNEKIMDEIIDEMIDTVEHSKQELFNSGEESQQEIAKIHRELDNIKKQVIEANRKGEESEKRFQTSSDRLNEMGKHFNDYTEKEIYEIYYETQKVQTDLTITREKVKNLREKQRELEERLAFLQKNIHRADRLVGKVSVVLNYLNDDFRQVSELINDAQEKQEFGLRIIDAQEEERRRLSREMHDGPAQMLANILLRSELIDRIVKERSTEEAVKEINNLRTMVSSSLSEVRRIIYDLRPMALDDLGLEPTIKKYLVNMEQYHGITIHFHHDSNNKRLDIKYEVAVFRLVQESVHNVIKHAGASFIDVRYEINSGNILIIIEDDGQGFDLNQKKDDAFGLLGMKERVEVLNGNLEIDSAIGQGTKVSIQIPINKV